MTAAIIVLTALLHGGRDATITFSDPQPTSTSLFLCALQVEESVSDTERV